MSVPELTLQAMGENMGEKEGYTTRSAGTYAVPPPSLEPGQVYFTKTGSVFHTSWCQIVHRTWEYKGKSLLVARPEELSDRRLCASCKEPG